DGGRDQRVDGGRIAHVGQHRQRLAAGGGDLGGDGLDGLAIPPAVDDHGRTCRRQRQGNGTADVATRASHQGYASVQIIADGHSELASVLAPSNGAQRTWWQDGA